MRLAYTIRSTGVFFIMSTELQQLNGSQFAEVMPVMTDPRARQPAITVHVAGVAADIHNGADPATMEAVLRILKLC